MFALNVALQTASPSEEIVDIAAPVLEVNDLKTRVREAEVQLQVAILEKQSDDRRLAASKRTVEELSDEAAEIVDSTVDSAIANYRSSEFDVSATDLETINESLRASELGLSLIHI